jgi:geranylgeranyl reductase family protein
VNAYDVVIVGAGPAGSTLGYELARRNMSVLILEKEKLPRNKTCAGGVTFRAHALLDFDISAVTQRLAYGMRISYQLGDFCVKKYRDPLAHLVMRRDFDSLLVKKAQDAGATVIDGLRADQVSVSHGQVEVLTKEGPFRAKIAVGADGANSTVASKMGLMKDAQREIALEAEVSVSQEKLDELDSFISVDFGRIPGGYGWVFPKKSHISAGVTGPARLSGNFKPYLDRILQQFGEYDIIDFSGHVMPMRRRGSSIQRGNVLLIGDAAGLIHPLSGEGIFYALKSAKLAVPAIVRALEAGTSDLSSYQRAVDSELMPGLEIGRILLKIYTRCPRLSYTMIKRSDRFWSYGCRALLGSSPAYS